MTALSAILAKIISGATCILSAIDNVLMLVQLLFFLYTSQQRSRA